MRTSSLSLIPSVLLLSLLGAVESATFAGNGIRSGPSVGFDFDVAAFPTTSGADALFIAWRDAQSNVLSGALHADDASFTPFPTLQSGYVANLNVGVGGPVTDRRAYVTWVGRQLELVLASFDAVGTLVSPAQNVASSVQISPNRLAGTNAGVLVGHIWDANPYWDPRILAVDVAGHLLGLEVAESVEFPEQTLGTTVAAEPGGRHAVVYVTSGTREVRLRRYDAAGALDPSPLTISRDATSDYVPLSVQFVPTDAPSTLLIAFPYLPPGASPDVRFALAPLSAGSVTMGPTLSELVPGFAGSVSDMAALTDVAPRAVVVWQEIEREDPATCGCSVPQPVRIDFHAQILALGATIAADGSPSLVYRWQTGDTIGPPITMPRVVASGTPGEFIVVWSDGVLRYRTIDGTPVAVELPAEMTLLSLASHPNPFVNGTTIAYSLSRPGPARLRIVDAMGRVVVQLSDGVLPQGNNLVSWDGRDRAGERVPAGVYFARLQVRGRVEGVKLILVK